MGIEGVSLLKLSDDAITRYLLEVEEPEWTVLKAHARFSERWPIFFLKRSRAISRNAIMEIYNDRQLRKNYNVNLALLRCRFILPPLAMNLIPNFRWMDLFNTLRLPTLVGAVRQKVESRLMQVYTRLALGEKITMARQAPRGLVRHLCRVNERQVVKALLMNYHFTYEDAMFMANYPEIGPGTLEELALSKRWRPYKEVRKSLLRNPKTPNSMIYPLAKTLQDFDLRDAQKDPRLTTYARRIVDKVLQEKLFTRRKPLKNKGASHS